MFVSMFTLLINIATTMSLLLLIMALTAGFIYFIVKAAAFLGFIR